MSVHGQALCASAFEHPAEEISQVIESLRRINQAGKEAPEAAAGAEAQPPYGRAGFQSGEAALELCYACKLLKGLMNFCQK
jgi:hypothetical protein